MEFGLNRTTTIKHDNDNDDDDVSDTANKSATSHCNGIWQTTRHNRHNGLLKAPTCYGLVTGKLQDDND